MVKQLGCCFCYSVPKLGLTLCHSMVCRTPVFPALHYLPEFAQTHVHWVGDAIQPSHPPSPSSPPALNLTQHQGTFQWVSLWHQVAKVLELHLQHQSFQWIFRADFLSDGLVWSPCCPRDSQESSPVPQFENISSSVLSLLYGPTLTSIPDYWKNQSFNHTDLKNSMKKHYLAHLLISESEHVAHSLFSGPLVKFEVKRLEKGRKKARISLEWSRFLFLNRGPIFLLL